MNAYLAVKTLHILSAAVLFGTGMGIAWFMLMAHRTRDLAAIRTTCRHVVVADWCFTAPAVVVQPLSGLWLMHAAGHAFDGGWFALVVALYGLAGICWLPVVAIQVRLRDAAQAAP